MNGDQVAGGLALVAGGAVVGAGVGAASNTKCDPNNQKFLANLFCGPEFGAFVGAAAGLLAAGAAGLIVAAASSKYRTAGLTAAGAATATILVAAAVGAARKKTS